MKVRKVLQHNKSFFLGKAPAGKMETGKSLPIDDDLAGFLNTVASRLISDDFSVQRDVRTPHYAFNILASRVVAGYTSRGAEIPASKVVSVIEADTPSVNGVSAYSSFMSMYVLDNLGPLAVRYNDLTTLPVMVSSSTPDNVKKWLNEALPDYSIIYDRTIFPVLVDIEARTVTYSKQTPFEHRTSYPELRSFSDKWFGFQ